MPPLSWRTYMTFEELVEMVVPSAFAYLGIDSEDITEIMTLNMKNCVYDAIYFVHERRGIEVNNADVDTYVLNRQFLIAQLASVAYNKIGVNGQTSHSENGISRVYDSSAYPVDLVSRIIPLVRSYGATESESASV